MSELMELAAKCESATGLDRELDGAIFECLGLTPLQERHCKDWCSQNGRADLTRAMYISAWAPDFTRSIDAAMTLVPDGFAWTLSTIGTGPFRYWASVGFPDEEAASYTATAATPALALTAAALRAKASTGTGEG